MRALVTGGAGYFGRVLVDLLRRRGERVRIFDLIDDPSRPPEVELERGDIRDPEAVRRACRGQEVVFHNVAQVPLAKDAGLFWSVNRDGTRNLLEAARKEGVRKVVYTSTCSVFGLPDRVPITDDMEPVPGEPYGEAKLAGERLCREFSDKGLETAIIRPMPILGGDRLGVFQLVFEWVFTGCNIPVLGRGDNPFQFIHCEDLAAACLAAARRPGSQVYNCGAERFGTMRETLEALCAHAGTGSRVRSVPMGPALAILKAADALGLSPLAPYHTLMYGRPLYFDIGKTKRELAWSPERSNAEMMIESYESYAAGRDAALERRGSSAHRSAVAPRILSLLKRFI